MVSLAIVATLFWPAPVVARTFLDYTAVPPIHVMSGTSPQPAGLTPDQVKQAYGLPATGGSGTIALIEAYGDPSLGADMAGFDKAFSLPACTAANGCLQTHSMTTTKSPSPGWAMETALDAEWAHAIAPKSRILVVIAGSTGTTGLMKALDYARKRSDAVAISMSWGGAEFEGEDKLDPHFLSGNSKRPMSFFASSGDDGAGPSWPATAAGVIAVGGTSLRLGPTGSTASEGAWSGSGGGVSAYESEPLYQRTYSIPRAGGKRAIPDVSYAADPAYGFSVFHGGTWSIVGGTSAGAPQWAAIAALTASARYALSPAELYIDKASTRTAAYFRDIVSGTNGACAYYCTARARYDYVTGLGSPVTYRF